MPFIVKLDTENAAFFEAGTEVELARILADLAARVRLGHVPPGNVHYLRDGNGNTVGTARWTP